jgi:glycerophosphoryl diester phosphodiesterase
MVLVIAHRGASARFRENTVEAFRGAIDLGADGVELDVRRTADGALAVLHDARLPDGPELVSRRSDELPPWLPSLDAALDACGELFVNIEIKNVPMDPDHDPDERVAAAVVDVIDRRAMHGRVLVSSFSLATIDRVRELDARVPTGWLVFGTDGAALAERAARHGHGALNPENRLVDADLVRRCHDAGLAVNVWTVDDPARIAELGSLGVDAVITNAPDVALAALGRG